MDKDDILKTVGDAWLNLTFLNYQAKVARATFLASLLDAEDNEITQEEMASVCVKGTDHISRSRIAQYIGQARKNDQFNLTY
jgi:hypothetical protein